MISIIMPLYNAERFLNEAIESVLAQAYDDFELICINDGSDDNTESIVRDFMARDTRISLIQCTTSLRSPLAPDRLVHLHGSHVK